MKAEMIYEKKYKIDSFKLLFDSVIFKKINIPEKYYLINDNGEVLSEIKKKGLEINFNEFTSIYVSRYIKILKNIKYDKVAILFSSKVAINYFNGIELKDIERVLNFLQEKKILAFDNIKKTIGAGYFKDLDIAKDIVFRSDDKERLKNNFKMQVKQYKGNNSLGSGIKLYDNKNNFGLSVNRRNGATLNKPFFKIYDKFKELKHKHQDFLNSLSSDLRFYLFNNLVIRFEFTLKDNSYFKKFDTSSKVLDFYKVLNNNPETIKKMQLYFINANFVKKEIVKNRNNLTPQQTIIARLLMLHMQDNKFKRNIIFYQNLFVGNETGTQATRLKQLFEKIYNNISNFETVKINQDIQFAKNYNELFI